jgi:hypothetical protein
MQLIRRPEGKLESHALRALKASALALSGLARVAAADAPIDQVYTSYSYSTYEEDDLDGSKGIPDSTRGRYEVETHQAMIAAPLTEKIDFSLEVTHETMSGASPWYTIPDAAGAPVQVMSGPTIEDQRDDFQLKTNYYLDNARLGLSGGYSSENDYSAMYFGFNGETHFNEKNTTLSGGIGMSFDEIDPTDADLYATRPSHEEKQTYGLNVGLSQILNRRSLVQTSLSYAYGTGYLSDPYKVVATKNSLFFADERPDNRHGLSWLTRYRRHIEEVEGTVHLSYQYYWDTWEVSSHTIELAWYQSFGDSITLTPSIRYYTQNEAEFYTNFLPSNSSGSGEYSSDFRLSTYGAIAFGLKGEYRFRTPWLTDIDWALKASFERYLSSGDLAWDSPSVEAPGLVNFNVLAVGLSATF